MPTACEIFAAALRRLSSSEDWCQGHYGKTCSGPNGGDTIYYKMADRVCMVGAVLLAGGRRREMDILRGVVGQYDIAEWNDTHTYDEVVGALQAALQAAQRAVVVEGRHHEPSIVNDCGR